MANEELRKSNMTDVSSPAEEGMLEESTFRGEGMTYLADDPTLDAEEEETKRRIVITPRMIKLGTALVFSLIILIFATIAWFTMNRESGTNGMSIKSQGRDFDLITLNSDATVNKNGAYYNPYHTAIRENDSEGYEIWLVDSSSNVGNYTSTGDVDETLGIEPGSSGIIKFYIRPYEDVTVRFSLQTIGYMSQTTTEGGQQTVTMTELSSEAGRPACFLNGHILLFEGKDTTTGYYNGLIPTGSDGKRVFTREFELNGSYDADINDDGNNDAYEVDIYWIWPETLDTLVYYSSSVATLICDRNATVPAGEENDYTKVVNNICTYPQYYLKGYSPSTTYTEQMVAGRNAMYNDADQDIGMNIEYVLLRLDAVGSSGE